MGAVVLVLLLVLAGLLGGRAFASDGGTRFYGHVFPVAGPHWLRGPIGEFGAPRSGYDPVLYGNYLLIGGEGERRSYFYAHLPRPSPLRRGDGVLTGQSVGAVGDTGNARTVGCHLHFEIHVAGQPIDPAPPLRRWDRYS